MKTLFLVGGITKHNYILKDFKKVFVQNNYDLIEEIDCEGVFDLNRILKGEIADRTSDVIEFYLRSSHRKKARELVQRKVLSVKTGEVDIIAHSLGTVICAGANIKIRKMTMLGSPFGFPVNGLRKMVEGELMHFGGLFGFYRGDLMKAEKLNYLFSGFDPVSMVEPNYKLLKVLSNSVCLKKTSCSHKAEDYFKELYRDGLRA